MSKNIIAKILSFIWATFGAGFILIILAGLFVYMAKDLSSKNYSFFMTYAQLSIMLFGITLIGGIFESSRQKTGKNRIIKKIFGINLSFLASFIGFMFLHAYIILDWTKIVDPVAIVLCKAFMFAAMIMGFFGLLMGIYLLAKTLLEHYSEL